MNMASKRNTVKKITLIFTVLVLMLAMAVPAFAASSGTLNVDGLTVSSSDNGTCFLAGNSLSLTHSNGGGLSIRKTATATLKNNSGKTATLSFDYNITQQSGDMKIDEEDVSGSGVFSKELANGKSVKISIKPDRNSTAEIIVTNIKLYSNTNITTTFVPSVNGYYTVDGAKVTSEASKTQLASQAYKLVATPDFGYQFLGWYDADTDEALGSNAEMSITFEKSRRVTAKFVSSSLALFDVAGASFADLNQAISYATKSGAKQITLLNSGNIPAGSYTIPAGKTLLIPHDSTKSVYTEAVSTGYTGTQMISAVAVAYTTPTAYRTMTMLPGADITVNGAICVGGKHCIALNYSGAPSGSVGMISMKEGSSITLNNGASLYCWGFIYGDGRITAKSGSAVHENFQFPDFRGGTVTGNLASEYLVFPLSQYYVQNVEVSTTYEYGSREKVWTSVFISRMEYGAGVDFIGSGAMFVPEVGSSITKKYNPETDRLEIEINGDAKINSMALELGGTKINSKDFPLPINSNIDIEIHSGKTTLAQTIAMLPGSTLTIDEGAELYLAKGELSSSGAYVGAENLFIYDYDEWTYGINLDEEREETGYYVYGGRRLIPVRYSPTRSYNRTESDLSDSVIDINGVLTTEGYAYTTAGGASVISSNKTGRVVMLSGAGQDEMTVQINQGGDDGKEVTVMGIPITSIALKNGDGEYTFTNGAEANSSFVYNAQLDQWVKTCVNHDWINASCTEPKTCSVCKTTEGTAIGHKWVAADCTTPKTCSVCKTTEGTANGHSFDYESGVLAAPTPNSKGYYTYACVECEADEIRYLETAGLFTVGKDTYYIAEDTFFATTGLVKISVSDEINYYYFLSDGKAFKAVGNDDGCIVEKGNGLELPEGIRYHFDGDGVILHDDTSRNGIVMNEDGYMYDYVDGVRIPRGLFERGGKYYYAKTSNGQIIVNGYYYVTQTNDLPFSSGNYLFGVDGAMMKDGFVEVDGNLRFYKDGKLFKGGLFEFEGNYYYARTTNGNIIRGRYYWVSKTNDIPVSIGVYKFDADGKITNIVIHDKEKNGFINEYGSLYYYVDGTRSHEGLVLIDGSFYYISTSSGKVICDRGYWVSKTNGLMRFGYYRFDKDGRMIDPPVKPGEEPVVKNGIVAENGSLYYYVNDKLSYAGLIKIGDDYYYVKTSSGEVVNGRGYWISKTNGLGISEGYYQFDESGKMIIK